MTALELENCPSFITYSQVEKSRILEMQSNMVLSSKNVKFRLVNEFFFARFLINVQYIRVSVLSIVFT